MIIDITQNTLNACQVAMMISEMSYPKRDQRYYKSIRPEIVRLLAGIDGCEKIKMPLRAQELQNRMDEIVSLVMEQLSKLRARINGDVPPLTFFVLTYCVWRGIVLAAFGFDEQWQPYRTLLEFCCSDLGLDKEKEIPLFEAKARALTMMNDEFVRDSDRIEVSVNYLSYIMNEVLERWSSPSPELGEQFKRLGDQMEAFRLEMRADHDKMFQILADLRRELVGQLITQGVDPVKAEAISDLESGDFLARLKRWSTSKKARDAVEAALWAALDFVPGGTGVKLGVKVLSAVRKSLT